VEGTEKKEELEVGSETDMSGQKERGGCRGKEGWGPGPKKLKSKRNFISVAEFAIGT